MPKTMDWEIPGEFQPKPDDFAFDVDRALSGVLGLRATVPEDAFTAPILETYEREGHQFYSSARLWDDGIIDPADTRQTLALGLSAAANAPAGETKYGVFRM